MKRPEMTDQLRDETITWDIVIIGGGATGLGIAMDAAIRGYTTLLLEQSDFAKGTSSRSTKLIHGGVRYLAQGKVKLVLEALKERGLLLQNAAHVVKKQAFVIPAYSWWQALYYLAGLKLYDVLAGKWSLGASKFINRKQALKALPTVNHKALKGGILYYDSQFDDTRLAINLAQTAVENGACVINYMRVTDLLKDEAGKINGVAVQDLETGSKYTPKAKAVINATGVFVDDILRMEQHEAHPLVQPSQGVHLVLDQKFLPGSNALLVPKTDDGRVLFAVPWHRHLLVGTTDTLRERAELEPRALEQEIDFILGNAGRYLHQKPQREDVLSVFAGLRPLAAHQGNEQSTKDISRNYKIIVSPAGLVTVTGGKWTIFRKMAEDTIDRAIKTHHLPLMPCQTAHYAIHGNTPGAEPGCHLSIYGTDAKAIKQLMQRQPSLAERLHPSFPHYKAEIVWAVRSEMARTIEDVLARRLRLLFLDARAAMNVAPEVARILALELGRSPEWELQQARAFIQLAEGYLAPAN
ncbi:glycerol-3-phosphate dehydrogenase/oxidase [Pontibacter locisalis]|uniref:Glycerol-3-phosphate dehydrogenase/oxidase n=1 Tax=Pontibacter locisalis TaxID=1719035 RepID=A0ABW5IPC3_9BACT